MRVPGVGIQRRAKPEPADNAQSDNRDDHSPDRHAADLPGNARAAKVGDSTNPQHANGREADLHWGECCAKQLRPVTNRRDRDRHVGDQQRHAVSVVRHKVARLTEGVFGVAAHPAGLTAKHSAFSKCPRQRHRPNGCDQPGDNRDRPHFREFGGQHDDARAHHIHHRQNSELHNAHLIGFTHSFSPFSSAG
ncbi:hypothetical protein D3C78_529920 [compost metagenome]